MTVVTTDVTRSSPLGVATATTTSAHSRRGLLKAHLPASQFNLVRQRSPAKYTFTVLTSCSSHCCC